MALGSSFVLETQSIIIEELSIISAEDIKVILDQLNKEHKDDKYLISSSRSTSRIVGTTANS